jgi:hypothetical protein
MKKFVFSVVLLFIFISIPVLACDYVSKENIVLEGKVIEVDQCISRLLVVLNNAGIKTLESCCGHGRTDGYILTTDFFLIISKERGFDAVGRYSQFNLIAEDNAEKSSKARDK